MKTKLKIHNSLNSSRPFGRLLENPKTWGSIELSLPENGFKNDSRVNSRKWLENGNLWFLELYFYLKYISNKDDIWQGKTLSGVLLEERKLNISKHKKNFIMVA